LPTSKGRKKEPRLDNSHVNLDTIIHNLDNVSAPSCVTDKSRNRESMRTASDARGQEIRQFILARIDEHPRDIAQLTGKQFALTRQAVNLHLQRLLADRDLVRQGKTRRTRFYLAPKKTWQKHYGRKQNESDVWDGDMLPQILDLPDNALDIWRYCFTEMFNNAVDHSSGTRITVQLRRNAVNMEIAIVDNGVGIFKKIQRAMKFSNERYSALELAKGKFTTDPARHTGEGIFFTSKMLDAFDISSGGVQFTSVSPLKNNKGTAVWMKLKNASDRSRKEIFDTYASPESDYAFSKTVVPVKMAEQNPDDLISRSQAKRLLLRVDRFRTVVLDFQNVNQIGQAFGDEIFRVFARSHPSTDVQFINSNEEVLKMIRRAQNA
jgi:anti-sigma regulatory factor (Ser/Thr protein kinase)